MELCTLIYRKRELPLEVMSFYVRCRIFFKTRILNRNRKIVEANTKRQNRNAENNVLNIALLSFFLDNVSPNIRQPQEGNRIHWIVPQVLFDRYLLMYCLYAIDTISWLSKISALSALTTFSLELHFCFTSWV